jgi:hypothetical protein
MDPVAASYNLYNLNSSQSTVVRGVPPGTGYTVKVSVFNQNASTGVPVVQGSASGVDVIEGQSTALTIQCLPVSPVALAIGTASAPAAIKYLGESWYSLQAATGTTYYFSTGGDACKLALFDGDGALIDSDSGYIEYRAAKDGPLYAVLATNDWNFRTTPASCSIIADTKPPILNEGSPSAPLSLALDADHLFKAGSSGVQYKSYYSFATLSAGTCAVSLGSSSCDIGLYADAGYSSPIVSAYSASGLVMPGLAASTTYYLMITNNNYFSSLRASGMVVSSEAYAADRSYEGSPAAPVELALGQVHDGRVGCTGYGDRSYYKAITGEGTDYRLAIVGINASDIIEASIYSDATFLSEVDSEYANLNFAMDICLAPRAAYYIEVRNRNSSNRAIPYEIDLESREAPSAFLPLLVATDDAWTAGSMISFEQEAWYVASVEPGSSYTLYLDDAEKSSGTKTLNGMVEVYDESRSGKLADISWGGMDGESIGPVAGDKIYVRVLPLYNPGSYALKLVVK